MQKTLEKLDSCPICGNKRSEKYLESIDYTVSREQFDIVKCQNCSFIYTNPRPNEVQIGKYYQSENYISHSDTNKGLVNKVYHIVRKQTLQNKLHILNSHCNKGKVLDIGCGIGGFLQVCERDGWHANGIEPDDTARRIAKQKVKGTIETDIFTSFKDEVFDGITMWHVLEHVHQLNKAINKIKQILALNGKLIIAVPNANSFDAKLYKEYWAAYDVPRHLYHFTKETISLLMNKHGIKLVEVIPMKFDAFYISLLSSKYRNNKLDYFQGFSNGVKSNRWAKNNENNYSSLTYIFSH